MLILVTGLTAAACALATGPSLARLSPAAAALETSLLDLCVANAPDSDISSCIAQLEEAGGITDQPAQSPLIEGDWELLHTSRSSFDARNPLGRRVDGSAPGLEGWIATVTGGGKAAAAAVASSSPIQRAVTGAFRVTQTLRGLQEAGSSGRVEQLVSTPLGELHLNAAARTDPSDGRRVLFAFDEGYFESSTGGVRLPYPVPFKLLGKEAEGFLDTSFLGERLRVSTGNKGTTFVLKRAVALPAPATLAS